MKRRHSETLILCKDHYSVFSLFPAVSTWKPTRASRRWFCTNVAQESSETLTPNSRARWIVSQPRGRGATGRKARMPLEEFSLKMFIEFGCPETLVLQGFAEVFLSSIPIPFLALAREIWHRSHDGESDRSFTPIFRFTPVQPGLHTERVSTSTLLTFWPKKDSHNACRICQSHTFFCSSKDCLGLWKAASNLMRQQRCCFLLEHLFKGILQVRKVGLEEENIQPPHKKNQHQIF